MTESRRPENLQRTWLVAGCVVLAIIPALGSTFAEMFRLWISIDQFNHCLLIVPASLWMIWRRRSELELRPANCEFDNCRTLLSQRRSGSVKLQCGVARSDECPVWMAPALQAFFAIAMVCQYSRVSGLFAWRLPLAMMSFASKVPIG